MTDRSSGKKVKPGEKWIQVRVPAHIEAWLKERAELEDTSVSRIMRRLAMQEYDRHTIGASDE